MANLSDKAARGPVAEPGSRSFATASGAAAPSAETPSGAAFSAKTSGRPSPSQADRSLAEAYSEASRGGDALGGEDRRPAGQTSAGIKETAQAAADALRQAASELAGDVGHELKRTGEVQKARGVEAMRRLSEAIDSTAGELEDQSPAVARKVHEAARGVKSLSDNLSSRNVNDLIDSAAELARARPALFIGGAIAAGFAFARFLKSSGQSRPASGYDPYQS